MTKQEEIIEGVARKLYTRFELGKDGVEWELASKNARAYFIQAARALMSYLHSQGVVIRADRELPENPYDMVDSFPQAQGYRQALEDMAGYVAVESLTDDS